MQEYSNKTGGKAMAFKVSDFGSLSASLQEFADQEGWIPSDDDDWQDFRWSHQLQRSFANEEDGERIWNDFLNRANHAIEAAQRRLEDLENSDEWYMGKPHQV
jgi:hypothetical protein